MDTQVRVHEEGSLDNRETTKAQWYDQRNARTPVDTIVLHTSEQRWIPSTADQIIDNLEEFIATRTDYGSYHWAASNVEARLMINMGRTAFHAKGWNSRGIGIGFTIRADQWPALTPAAIRMFIQNGAFAAAQGIRWAALRGTTIEPKLLTDPDAGGGFVYHRHISDQRTDPGVRFPEAEFFAELRRQLNDKPTGPVAVVTPPQPPTTPQMTWVTIQRLINRTEGTELALDGVPGPKTLNAVYAALTLPRPDEGEVARLKSLVDGKDRELTDLRATANGARAAADKWDQLTGLLEL